MSSIQFVLNDVFGPELMRYYLLREMVFGQDCNFSYDAIVQRWNSDLANDLGNLLSRTSAMIVKYREGKVPSPGTATGDEDVRNLSARVIRDYRANFEDYSFSRALENVWELIARVNKYIVENEPWALAEKPAESAKARQRAVSFSGGSADRLGSPGCGNASKTAQSIWEQLGLDGQVRQTRLDRSGVVERSCREVLASRFVSFPKTGSKGSDGKTGCCNGSETGPQKPDCNDGWPGLLKATPLARHKSQ